MKKGFNENEGPFVKTLDSALHEIGVQPQQYFGGAFIEIMFTQHVYTRTQAYSTNKIGRFQEVIKPLQKIRHR